MTGLTSQLLTELRALIGILGTDGGRVSPSIYDTAQVLRYAPPHDPQPVIDWLLAQQKEDGGWGDPLIPLARHPSTLAAVLALDGRSPAHDTRRAVAAGERWLRAHHAEWQKPLPEGLPVGVELILPHLQAYASDSSIASSLGEYTQLNALGTQRRRRLRQMPVRGGTPAVHTWEAWGTTADAALLDATGSVGHSPAATAAWLYAARGKDILQDASMSATRYLEWAARATETKIPGVVPTVFPITRFEQTFGLYTLLLSDLLDHPALQPALSPQLDDLAAAIGKTGMGFSDYFQADGDDTAVALAVMRATGYATSLDPLYRFAANGRFCAYHGELQSSPSVVAHALHTLALFGEHSPNAAAYLADTQHIDGRWAGDKWNGSWLYVTSHVLMALQCSRSTGLTVQAVGEAPSMYPVHATNLDQPAVDALLMAQHDDGGWGTQSATMEETAYAVLALQGLRRQHELDHEAACGLRRGEEWLIQHYKPYSTNPDLCWLGKEAFRPYRLARMAELVATLRSFENVTTVLDERNPT